MNKFLVCLHFDGLCTKRGHVLSGDQGFSLLEVLVAIVFIGIVSLSISSSIAVALKTEKNTEVHFAASVLASDRMEQLSALDAIDLDSSYNESGASVSWNGLNINFLRSTTVTVNADDSRTIDVSITTDNANFPINVSFSSTTALWE